MPTKQEILLSTLEMLNNRYDSEHNVTIQSVVEKHLKNTFQLRRYLCRRTAKSICSHLEDNEIFLPYIIDGGQMKRTWSINFDQLNDFLKDDSGLGLTGNK